MSGVTVAQVMAAAEAFEKVNVAAVEGAMSSRFSNVADDAIVAEDILAILAPFFPEVGALEDIIALLSALLPVAAALKIQGDPNPIEDAQTTRAFNPGDPAARL